jgi:hypothetical protein
MTTIARARIAPRAPDRDEPDEADPDVAGPVLGPRTGAVGVAGVEPRSSTLGPSAPGAAQELPEVASVGTLGSGLLESGGSIGDVVLRISEPAGLKDYTRPRRMLRAADRLRMVDERNFTQTGRAVNG